MAKRGKRVYRTQAKSTRTGQKEKLKYFIYLKIASESNIHKVEEPEALMFVNCPRQVSLCGSPEKWQHTVGGKNLSIDTLTKPATNPLSCVIFSQGEMTGFQERPLSPRISPPKESKNS